MIINLITVVLILSGLLFFLGAAVGIIRFPDFYTRMHAAGKGDTLSTLLILLGLIVYSLEDFSLLHLLVAAKIFGICLFISFTSPTSTHALMQAGYEEGIRPWRKDGAKEEASE